MKPTYYRMADLSETEAAKLLGSSEVQQTDAKISVAEQSEAEARALLISI